MTSQIVGERKEQGALTEIGAEAALWRTIWIDLGFWTLAGLLATPFSQPLGTLTGIGSSWFLGIGGLFAVGGASLIWFLSRRRPVQKSLVQAFWIFNFVAPLLIWGAALMGLLPTTTAGTWGAVLLGDVMLVLGIYQFFVWRKA